MLCYGREVYCQKQASEVVRYAALVLLVLLTGAMSCGGLQAAPVPESIDDPGTSKFGELFELWASTPLNIELVGPWRKLARDAATDPEMVPAQLKMQGLPTVEIKVRPRGKSRRRQDFCRFPPLWLDLPKKQMRGSIFAGQNKLKLVTQCVALGSVGSRADDRVWSEFLLYKVLNLLTPTSFRVRAVRVTYTDTANARTYEHPGFLIEHKKQVIQRLGVQALDVKRLSVRELDAQHGNLIELFQYFAGNTDFSLLQGPKGERCCHNVVPMRNPAGKVLSVAYDFDSTGFVDPPYGAPVSSLGISKLTQRLYRGYCATQSRLDESVQAFVAIKKPIGDLIDNQPGLSAARQKKLRRYTDAFYRVLEDPKVLAAKVSRRCR